MKNAINKVKDLRLGMMFAMPKTNEILIVYIQGTPENQQGKDRKPQRKSGQRLHV